MIREVKEETGISYEIRLAFVNECIFYGDGTLTGKEIIGAAGQGRAFYIRRTNRPSSGTKEDKQ